MAVPLSRALFGLLGLVFTIGLHAQGTTLPPTLTGISGGGSVDIGQRVTLIVNFSGTGAGQTYEWRRNGTTIANATANSFVIEAATPADGGTYAAVVTNAAGTSIASTSIAVRALAPPVITTQPRNSTLFVGQAATFSFVATGSFPRTYQWRKGGNDIPGATLATYTIAAVGVADAGAYAVVVSNAQGSAASAAATLTVNAAIPPVIASDSPQNATVQHGQELFLQVLLYGGSPPFSLQWFRNGTAIAGANNSNLAINPALPSDAGNYSVVVTNPAGTATSRTAVVTITPATPIVISGQPQTRSDFQGQGSGFSVSLGSGSSPVTYQWYKDGVLIPGAIYGNHPIYGVTFADAGNYHVVVTNIVGSVTSAAGLLTVKPAVPPVITGSFSAQTLAYQDTLRLGVNATGSEPLSYLWKKDGVVIQTGYSSVDIFGVTPAQSGLYSVTVSNAGGSDTWSRQITVLPALMPAITTQPVALQLAAGTGGAVSVQVPNTGTGSLAYRWSRNGIELPDGYSSSYYIPTATAADAGDYSVTITGPGGTVTSQIARVNVGPPVPPILAGTRAYERHTTEGSTETFYAQDNIGGSAPFTYQWNRDGVPIPGATGTYFYFSPVTARDFASYTLSVSNAGGVSTTFPFRLRRSPYAYEEPATPWFDAGQVRDVAYFVAKSPSRIERYDMAAERWLPTVFLGATQVPTAFAVATDGIYVAYDRTLTRRSLDLVEETVLANSPTTVRHLFPFGNYLYYNSDTTGGYATLSRFTAQAGPTVRIGTNYSGYRFATFAPGSRKGFAQTIGSSSSDIETFGLNEDGTATTTTSSPYFSEMPKGQRTFVFPGEQLVANNSGTVYRASDLTYAGSLGDAFDDLAFLVDGTPVALGLGGISLRSVRADNFLETGRTALARAGVRLFVRNTDAFVFGPAQTSGGSYDVAKVTKAELVPAVQPAAPPPTGRYSIDDAFLGADGVVHVFSRSLGGLVKWSAATGEFLPTVKLRGVPALAVHQPGATRALFFYGDGQLTEVPLRAAASEERQVAAVGHRARSLVDLGDMVAFNLDDGDSSGDFRMVVANTGDVRHVSRGTHYGNVLAWQASARRLFSVAQSNLSTLQFETVPASGTLPDSHSGTASPVTPLQPPYRLNPEGTLLLTGGGQVLGSDLTLAGTIGNTVTDGAWLPTGLYTVRSLAGETQVQRWTSPGYVENGTLTVRGVPVRIFRRSDTQLVVVTAVQGTAAFTIVNADLSVATVSGQPLAIASQPASRVVAPAASATFSVAPGGAAAGLTYQWMRNGSPVANATASSLTVTNVQPANAGIYTAVLAGASSQTTSQPAILGVTSTGKVLGAAAEIGPDITHPNGRVYDQILLQGSATTVTADAGQVVRISFVDLTKDIVQVEFSGAGALSLVLDATSGPGVAENYNQAGVNYVKGHAGIVITGANETTNVTVFSVGRATAVNQALFRSGVAYDGQADIAYIAIASANGKFGGIRTANASYFNTKGIAGIYAPGVEFTGPVFVGDLNAFDHADPMLVLGSAADVRVNGGDLTQDNGRAVQVKGIALLQFVAGSSSHGAALPAKANRARLLEDGVDVTSRLVPTP